MGIILIVIMVMAPQLHAHLLLRTDCRGDIFAYDDVSECGGPEAAAVVIPWTSGNACQCAPPTTTFRLDTGACVDKLHECLQVPLDSKAEIPVVPTLFHDHPVRFNSHLAIHKVVHFENFACRVSQEKYLSAGGWLPLANLSSAPFTFQLVERKDREIALNFLGSDEESWRLEGRLIRVGLSCQSAEKANIVPQPCIAFRVGGATAHQPEEDSLRGRPEVEEEASGLNKWLIIALGAGLLGVTYVLAILVYVLIRKRSDDDVNSSPALLARLASCARRCCCRRKKEKQLHRKRLCERCMTSSSVLKWVHSQSHLERKEPEEENGGMSNVTVVSVNSPSMTNGHHHHHQQQQKKSGNRLARSKSDLGLANGRKASQAKRSESLLMAKCVSFDPNEPVVIEGGGRKLVTFASLQSVRDEEEASGGGVYEAAGPASILKKQRGPGAQVPAPGPPPRFLLTSFNRKQRRGAEEAEVGKAVKPSAEDLGYHSGDSERVHEGERIDFTQDV